MYWQPLEMRFRVLTFLEILPPPDHVFPLQASSGIGADRQTVYGFANVGATLLASSLSSLTSVIHMQCWRCGTGISHRKWRKRFSCII